MNIHQAVDAMLSGYMVRRPSWPQDKFSHSVSWDAFINSDRSMLSHEDVTAEDWEP